MSRVLVLEDDEIGRDLMAFRLESAGFEVRTPAAGVLVRDAADAEVSAVVLEERMPGVNTLALCRQLREDPATAGTPILMVSRTGGEEETLAAFAAGADEWLMEPLHALEFDVRVRAVIARCHRHQVTVA